MEGRRRLTLLEQMSASTNGRALAGLSLNDVLTPAKPPPPAPAIPASISGRTLLDIIRDEEPKSYKALIGKKDTKKPWKSFKDRLRLKKAGAAWSSSVRVPTSDIPLPRHHSHSHGHHQFRSRRNSVRYVTTTPTTMSNESQAGSNRPPTQFANPMFNRCSSARLSPAAIDEVESPRRRFETAERSLSAREAVAAQEAAEAAAGAAKAKEEGEGSAAEPVRMSLMDLLEETDREMGLEGGRYTMDEDEDEEEEEEEEEVEEQAVEEEAAVGGDVEYSCCVCMVRHKGAAFIPCGHTFCRMCSRELFVQRGNCPLCNNFILEILDIF